jgi:hypothetical protein
MVKGVPSERDGTLFFMVFSFRFSVKAKSSCLIGIKAIEKTPTSIGGDRVPGTIFLTEN